MKTLEIKTLRDLKTVIDKIREINKQKQLILNNDDISKNQAKLLFANFELSETDIENILNKYSYIFNVKRGDLRLEDIFKKYQITYNYNPYVLQTETYQECFYKDRIMYDFIFKDEVEVEIENSKETIVFADFNYSSYNEFNELKYLIGDYSINVLGFLLEDKYLCSSILQEACWNAVASKYEKQHSRQIEKKVQDKNLLMRKLEILENEELRNNEIASLKNQITELTKETKLIENDNLNINININ